MGIWSALFFLTVAPLFQGEEYYLRNLVKLTEEGINAEAYFSFDGRFLIFQSTREDSGGCDQIYILELASGEVKKISAGGRTTCAYFFPDGKEVLYSSTIHLGAG
ncbi:MAG: TolB family protein, partial [bacterium]